MNMLLTANVVYAYIDSHLFLIGVFIVVLIVELIIRMYVDRLRRSFTRNQDGILDEVQIERLSIEYYSKKQRTMILRTVILSLAILVSIMYYDIRAFSFVAVALGGLIIAFKETVVSVLSYFHILRNYRVGDDVLVGEVRGEILNIRPTVTTILGKSDDSEYNGKVTTVQNYHFVLHPVERQEMKTQSYLLSSIEIPFSSKDFRVTFVDFIDQLKQFLDGNLPRRGTKNVGNFRSYAGSRYKLGYKYDVEGKVLVTVAFVSKSKRIADRKEKIIAFVESLKKW